jgi:hypothetical protein
MTTTDKNQSADPGKSELSRPAIRKIGPTGLPRNLFRYVLEDSGLHQLFLAALAAGVFLLEFVPLELTRRIINDVTKHRDFRLIVLLGAFYFAVILVQGSTKLAPIVAGSKSAPLQFRNSILCMAETVSAGLLSLVAPGMELSMVV